MKYADKLKDPRWQKKRLEIFNRDAWACRCCKASDSTLAVHHVYYAAGKEPWEYPNEAFITLCDACHNKAKTVKISQILKQYLSILESQIKKEYDNELSRKIDCVIFLLEGV